MLPDNPNGIITQYSTQFGVITANDLGNDMLMGTVGGLSPLTMYELLLRAHTIVGEGPSTSVTVATSELLNIVTCLVCV